MNKKFIDLHIHTYYSDGGLSPSKIVKMAAEKNLSAIAITDHNTIAGVYKAQKEAKKRGIIVLSGIELDTNFQGYDFHILGYGMDIKNKKFLKALKKIRKERLQRELKMAKKMKKLGFSIDLKKLKDLSLISVMAKYHIVKLLMKNSENRKKVYQEVGLYPSLSQIINFYMIRGKKAYVEKKILAIEEIFDLIKKAGGVCILAHPGLIHPDWKIGFSSDRIILKLVKLGLDGIEVYSPKHTPPEEQHYKKLAKKYNLLITGGTDFHGEIMKGVWPDQEHFGYKVPFSLYKKLSAALARINPN